MQTLVPLLGGAKSESLPKWSLKLCSCKAESVNVAGLKDALPPRPPARGSTKVQTLVPLLGGAKSESLPKWSLKLCLGFRVFDYLSEVSDCFTCASATNVVH